MPWTKEELEAIRKADKEIDRSFHTADAHQENHKKLDQWLDDLARSDRLDNSEDQRKEARKKKKAAWQRAYYKANKEKVIAYRKSYYAAHKEELAARKKAYYQAHKDEYAERSKAYRAAKRKIKEATE